MKNKRPFYYVSQYLNVYPSKEGTCILYHGIQGSIDEVTTELGKTLKKFQNDKIPLISDLPENVLSYLAERGHLTNESPFREYESAKKLYRKFHKQNVEGNKRSGLLMLVPSYDCNLACPYCYQCKIRQEHKGRPNAMMTTETVDLIFGKALKRLYPHVDRLSNIYVTFYGGEPFLIKHRRVVERVIHYTKKYQMSVHAVSNATTLHELMEFVGKERGLVSSIQISFDGDKDYHDKSRITPAGEGTFDCIIQNIHRLVDRDVIVSIRINTSKFSLGRLKLFEEALKKEGLLNHPNIQPYAAAIHGHMDDNNSMTYGTTESKISLQIEKEKLEVLSPLERTKSRLAHIFQSNKSFPQRRTHFCMQNSPHSFVLDPFKRIYGCYEESGKPDLAVGKLFDDGTVKFNERYKKYQKRHLANLSKCSRCPVGLTCAGGCAAQARGKDSSIEGAFKNICYSNKELVAMAVKELYHEQKQGILKNMAPVLDQDFGAEQPML